MQLAKSESVTRIVTLPDWVYEILENDRRHHRFWIPKGLGAGGTYGAAIWHYVMCLINYKSQTSWAIAPTYQQVADTMIPSMVEVLQAVFGLEEGSDFNVVRSQFPRIDLKKNKQSIVFKSANRPERFVGPSVSHCWMTEPGLIKREAYEKSSARLRCPKAERLQYLLEGTPEGLGNFFEQEANFEEGLDEVNNRTRLTLWTHDNPILKADYVENLKRTYSYDPHKLESYLYGKFVPFTKGTAYWEFKHSRNVKLDLKASPLLPLTITWDWNHTPLAWCAVQKQTIWSRGTKYDRYTVLNESSGKHPGIMDSCAEFIAAFPPEEFRETPIRIDGGCDGFYKSHLSASCAFDQVYDCLKKYYRNVTIVASRAAPLIKDRLQKHNALLAYGYLVIAAWCRNTIKSHELTNLVDGDPGKIAKPNGDLVSHWGDGLGYHLFQETKNLDLQNPNAKQIYGFN